MGTKIGGVGTSGDTLTYFKTPVSIGIQLDPGEYPSGVFTMPNLTGGGARWRNGNYGTALAVWLCLCDSAGNNKIRIASFTIAANSTSYQNTWTVTGAEALAGKALYLIMEDSGYDWDTRDYTALQSWTGISCETAQNNFSIGMLGGTGGTIACNKYSAAPGETITVTCTPETGWKANAPTSSPAVTMTSAGANKWTFTMPSSDIIINPSFSKINYTVSVSTTPSGSGSASLSKTTANYGDQITVTTTPGRGWKLKSITTSPSLTVSNNKFTMPAGNVAVTVTFEKISYSITKGSSPSGAGTVTTNKNTANYGDTITVSQTPASGYYFNGWTTSPANLISSGQFTMPDSNVSITANYLKRSTASTDKTNLTSGGTVKLTISADKSTYTHKYRLNFGTGMDSGWVNVAAGVSVVNISVPDSWASSIPSATQKTGGTLTVETYNGSTKIGEYTLTGFIYNVRSNAVPTLGTITESIARTIGGVIYANVGNYYVQNKCGVRVQGSASGVLGSKISKIEISLSGYSAAAYKGSATGSSSSLSIDWTSGLLTISGTVTITVTATDSRGRTVTGTKTITVTAYSRPSGSLAVRRVNSSGNDDVMGTYAKYTKTSSYTSVGSNALTVTLTDGQGHSVTNPANSGDLLPGNRKQYAEISEYEITLTLQDSFETVSYVVKLPTAQFLISAAADGTRLALMKAVNESLSKNSKNGVLEISDLVQVYIGTETLEAFIRRIANS